MSAKGDRSEQVVVRIDRAMTAVAAAGIALSLVAWWFWAHDPALRLILATFIAAGVITLAAGGLTNRRPPPPPQTPSDLIAPIRSSAAAPASPESRWAAARRRHREIVRAHAPFLSDPIQALELPALHDQGDPANAELRVALAAARHAETDRYPGEEMAAEYGARVQTLAAAWRVAHQNARVQGLSGFSPTDRQSIREAIEQLRQADRSDDAQWGTHTERAALLIGALTDRGVLALPPRVLAQLEGARSAGQPGESGFVRLDPAAAVPDAPLAATSAAQAEAAPSPPSLVPTIALSATMVVLGLVAGVLIGSSHPVVLALIALWLTAWIAVPVVRRSRAPKPPDPRVHGSQTLWAHTVQRHNAVLLAYLPFETDPEAVLRHPALTDVTVGPTQRFLEASQRAAALRTDSFPTDDEMRRSYSAAVTELETAWELARRHATRIGRDYLDARDARLIDQAAKLLAQARSAQTPSERLAYAERAQRVLDALAERGVIVLPPRAAAALEMQVRRAIEGPRAP